MFGYAERLDDYRMARRVLMAEVSGGRILFYSNEVHLLLQCAHTYN